MKKKQKKLVRRTPAKKSQLSGHKGEARPKPPPAPTVDDDETTSRATTCAHCGLQHSRWQDLQQHLAKSACGPVLDKARIRRPRLFTTDPPEAHLGCSRAQPLRLDAPAAPEQLKARSHAMVVVDSTRTALELSRAHGVVTYIPHCLEGFDLLQDDAKAFDQRYKPLADYPTGRCAALFVGYSQSLGATSDVMNALATLVSVTKEESEMAQKKKSVTVPKASTKSSKPKAEKTPGAPRGPSAASMFKELIMSGKLTDDQIFKKVQDTFKLDDKKRSYVAWYRNSLKKAGEKVPEAVA